MRNQNVTFRTLTPAIGAEVSGVDLSRDLDVGTIDTIRAALLEHQLLVFRDQDITPDQQVAFSERFGEVEDPHPVFDRLEINPKITIIESKGDKGYYNDAWHSDVSFKPRPALGSLLYARILPPAGGDTLWASMYAAYEALSEPMKAFLAGLTATHDFAYAFADSVIAQGGADKLEEGRRKNPPISHPVIRTHPETGRPLLYVSETFTSRINELNAGESKALLAMLVEHIRRPEFQVRITWAPGTLAFWDNRSTQHYAARDYVPHHRVMHRVTLLGDAPFYNAA
jgi:taurine dioxygenase